MVLYLRNFGNANFLLKILSKKKPDLSSIIKDFSLDKDLYKYKEIRNRISMFKNNLITVNAYQNNSELVEYDLVSRRPKMGEVYKEYVERCFRYPNFFMDTFSFF